MNKLATMAALAFGLALQPTAHADEEDAEVCLRTKVWDGYSDGWAIRTMTSATLQSGGTRNYLVTLYAGNEYKIQACGDDASANVNVYLYNLEGKVVSKVEEAGREPSLTYTPDKTATFYVVVYAQALASGQDSAGVGLAVTYR